MNAWLTHTHKAALFAFAVGYNYGFDLDRNIGLNPHNTYIILQRRVHFVLDIIINIYCTVHCCYFN